MTLPLSPLALTGMTAIVVINIEIMNFFMIIVGGNENKRVGKVEVLLTAFIAAPSCCF